MRKLAPIFVMTSIVALAGGTALADTEKMGATTSSTASPTVSANTSNPQGLSYSDKSNASPGTNAAMDDKSKVAATTDDDKSLAKTMKKKQKARVASNTRSDMATTGKLSATPPISPTNGAAVNSTSGVSGGQ